MKAKKIIVKTAKKMLEKNAATKTEIANELGISRSTLYRAFSEKEKTKANDFSSVNPNNLLLNKIYDYQKEFLKLLKNKSKIFVLKSRQIGFSHIIAFWALKDILISARAKIFLSASKKQVNHLKSKVKQIAFELTKVKLKGSESMEIFLPGNKTSSLHFLSTNSSTCQGFTGDVLIDEACWIPRFDEVIESILPSRLLGGKAIFISTPSSKDHPSYKLFKAYKKDGDTLKVSLDDAVKGGLKTYISKLELQNELGEDGFLQFFMCKWRETGCQQSFFKREDIEKCFYKKLIFNENEKKIWQFLKINYSQGPVILGVDPSGDGNSGDAFSICAIEVNEKIKVIEHFSSSTIGFNSQVQSVLSFFSKYKPIKIAIDTGAEGIYVGKKIEEQLHKKTEIKLFKFTSLLKKALVKNFAKILSEKKFLFDKDDLELQESIMSINILSSRNGQSIFKTKRSYKKSGNKHGDIFWALALASYESEINIQKENMGFSCIQY